MYFTSIFRFGIRRVSVNMHVRLLVEQNDGSEVAAGAFFRSTRPFRDRLTIFSSRCPYWPGPAKSHFSNGPERHFRATWQLFPVQGSYWPGVGTRSTSPLPLFCWTNNEHASIPLIYILKMQGRFTSESSVTISIVTRCKDQRAESSTTNNHRENLSRIWGPHTGDYEENYLLGYETV